MWKDHTSAILQQCVPACYHSSILRLAKLSDYSQIIQGPGENAGADTMDTALVEQVRSFNRSMTERVGALNDHFLGRNHPLSEARLLWEIGADGASVRELRRRLGLDSGYISRLLRALEGQGLIELKASPQDGRVRQVQLTRAGLRERAELDRRADAFACSVLEPLSESQRLKLTAAMAEVERL